MLVAAAGGLWAFGSAQYGDWREFAWCSFTALGFLGVAAAFMLRRGPRAALAGGLVLAGVAGGVWAFDGFGAGRWTNVWAWFGTGVIVAAAGGVLLWQVPAARPAAAWMLPGGFAVAFLSTLKMLRTDVGLPPDVSLWSAAALAACAGLALLAFRSGTSYARALDGDA